MKTGLLLSMAMVLGGGELWAQPAAELSGNWDESAASYPSAPVAAQYAQPPGGPVGPLQYGSAQGPVPGYEPAGGGYPIPQDFGPPLGFGTAPSAVPTAPPGAQLNPWIAPYADHYPLLGLYLFQDANTWRNFSNGDASNANGVNQGFNLGVPLPWLSQFGFGAQIGGSYNFYDFSGRSGDAPSRANSLGQQWFVTGGIFRHADADRRLSMGVVYDLMMNDNLGVFSAPPTMGQVRFQLGYALGYFNEVGVWGTVSAFAETVALPPNLAGYTSAYFKPINMLNMYWHHKWGLGGADSTLFVGVPRQTVLTDPAFGPNFGTVDAGGSMNVPLTDSFALYGNMMYLQPDTHTGFTPLKETWNISIGVAFYPGRAARSSTVAGRSSMPLLPVANNGNFLVNTNRTF